VLCAASATAQDALVDDQATNETRTFANLRIGPSTSLLHPQICAEVAPLDLVSIEACGTGSGFLHNDPAAEIAHFRGKVRLGAAHIDNVQVEPWLAAGFAELQVGEDGPGFDFFGTGQTGVETAGPDVGASVRALLPIGLGVELLGELGVGLAYFAFAPALLDPQAAFQPSASATFGVGF